MRETKEEEEMHLRKWGYEDIVIVGQGAFSRVYRVRDGKSGKLYACKISREQEMLRRESDLLQQISHPLFPAFDAFWRGNEQAFLLMEYIRGENLKELIEEKERLSEKQMIEIAMKLAEGLCYLHELPEPVIFRDVKPENIIIGEAGRVALLDLGSACHSCWQQNVITGTPGYGAPEQWNNREKVGAHSDVYALGQVMLTMLCGKMPVGIHSTKSRIEQLYTMDSRLHRGVIQLIEECTKEAVAERIPNMRSVIQRLKPYQQLRRGAILRAEWKARLCYKKTSEYIYQQNILKTNRI